MKAYNKRLNHRTEVKAIDYVKRTVKLVLPDSHPKFIYDEQLANVELQEDTGVRLNGELIYVGDTVVSTDNTIYVVEKVPGGYLPFMMPVRNNFRKANDEQ